MVQIIQRNSFRKKTFESVFISHMVQIIHADLSTTVYKTTEDFISHMVQIIHAPIPAESISIRLDLYIPHGSDNTLPVVTQINKFIPLYPTWFR